MRAGRCTDSPVQSCGCRQQARGAPPALRAQRQRTACAAWREPGLHGRRHKAAHSKPACSATGSKAKTSQGGGTHPPGRPRIRAAAQAGPALRWTARRPRRPRSQRGPAPPDEGQEGWGGSRGQARMRAGWGGRRHMLYSPAARRAFATQLRHAPLQQQPCTPPGQRAPPAAPARSHPPTRNSHSSAADPWARLAPSHSSRTTHLACSTPIRNLKVRLHGAGQPGELTGCSVGDERGVEGQRASTSTDARHAHKRAPTRKNGEASKTVEHAAGTAPQGSKQTLSALVAGKHRTWRRRRRSHRQCA